MKDFGKRFGERGGGELGIRAGGGRKEFFALFEGGGVEEVFQNFGGDIRVELEGDGFFGSGFLLQKRGGRCFAFDEEIPVIEVGAHGIEPVGNLGELTLGAGRVEEGHFLLRYLPRGLVGGGKDMEGSILVTGGMIIEEIRDDIDDRSAEQEEKNGDCEPKPAQFASLWAFIFGGGSFLLWGGSKSAQAS